MNNKITIVLPYGVFEETNLQYKKYLDQAINQINFDAPDKVIICGGLVKNGLSEAKSVANYLIGKVPQIKEQVYLEETSITTPQNLEFAAHIITSNHLEHDSIKIICDSIRLPKVFFFANWYMSKTFGYEISEEEILTIILTESVTQRIDLSKNSTISYKSITVQGVSLDRSNTEISLQIISTLEEIAAIRFPSIHKKILQLRQLQWQQEISNSS